MPEIYLTEEQLDTLIDFCDTYVTRTAPLPVGDRIIALVLRMEEFLEIKELMKKEKPSEEGKEKRCQ